jgi:hypothetical protein
VEVPEDVLNEGGLAGIDDVEDALPLPAVTAAGRTHGLTGPARR